MDIVSNILIGLGGVALGGGIGFYVARNQLVVNAGLFIVPLIVVGVSVILIGTGFAVSEDMIAMIVLLVVGGLGVAFGIYLLYSRFERAY